MCEDCLLSTHAHTHTHSHTRTHTRTHTHIHTQTEAYMATDIRTHTHTQAHTNADTHTHTHTDMCMLHVYCCVLLSFCVMMENLQRKVFVIYNVLLLLHADASVCIP